MRHFAAVILLALAPLLGACDDPNAFRLDPALVTDTVELAAPSPSHTLPTALDITGSGGFSQRGRFPERVQDAGAWDFAIRVRNGQLSFVPAAALGFSDPIVGGRSRAGITQPITGSTFESYAEAPTGKAFVTDSAVVIQQGALYAARSRNVACGFGSGQQYAKIQVLSVQTAGARVRLQITSNQNCSDPRLVPDETK